MADDKEQLGESSCSSSSSRRARQSTSSPVQRVNRNIFSDGEWDCSVCTYRNTADAFKCCMCDVRKGTSTRKPRINTDNVVAQVVRQQEQIRQQAIKLGKRRSNDNQSDNESTTSSKDISINSSPTFSKLKKSKKEKDTGESTSNSKKNQLMSPCSSNDCSPDMLNESSSSSTSTISSSSSSSASSNSTPLSPTPGSNKNSNQSENRDKEKNSKKSNSTPNSKGPSSSTSRSSISPTKLKSSLGGQVFKYQPPALHGKAGILIDRKKTTTRAVTVNNITVTITEYATRKRTIPRRDSDATSSKKKDKPSSQCSSQEGEKKEESKGTCKKQEKGHSSKVKSEPNISFSDEDDDTDYDDAEDKASPSESQETKNRDNPKSENSKGASSSHASIITNKSPPKAATADKQQTKETSTSSSSQDTRQPVKTDTNFSVSKLLSSPIAGTTSDSTKKHVDANSNSDRTKASETSSTAPSIKQESTEVLDENSQLPPLDPKKALYATMKR